MGQLLSGEKRLLQVLLKAGYRYYDGFYRQADIIMLCNIQARIVMQEGKKDGPTP